jgi:hypothetical protein
MILDEVAAIVLARAKADETQQWYEVWYTAGQYYIVNIQDKLTFDPEDARFIQTISPVLKRAKRD